MSAVRDTRAMITGMAPVLDETLYHFCVSEDETLVEHALAIFREDEGLTLILSDALAAAHGVQTDLAMRRITLSVHSALDGVGLTAAVATALAQGGIPCNMVAAYHHDHAFVPAQQAEQAMVILTELAKR
ncbi:MAG: ACT domain-containing protein [Roseovarius sp.]|nr:ACT domain-containing protein [Roseovarius sp.]